MENENKTNTTPEHDIRSFVSSMRNQQTTQQVATEPEPQKVEKPIVEPQKVEQPKQDPVKPDAQKQTVTPDAVNTDDGVSDFAKLLTEEDTTQQDATSSTKQEEPDDVSQVELPSTASNEAKDAFKKVKQQNAQFKNELRQLREERKQLEDKANSVNIEKLNELQEQLSQLTEQKAEMEKKLFALDIKESKPWKELVVQPLSEQLKAIDDIAEKYGVEAQGLRKNIIMEDTKKLTEMLTDVGIDSFGQLELAKIRDKVLGIRKLEETLKSDAEAAAKVLTEAEQSKMEKAIEAQRTAFMDARKATAETTRKSFPFLFKEIPGDTEWNSAVSMVSGYIEQADPTQLTPKDMGQSLAMAAVAPIALEALSRARKELAVYVNKYKKAIGATNVDSKEVVNATQKTQNTQSYSSIGDFVRAHIKKS